MYFQDIHYLALDKGERALAAVAKQKADEIEQELPSVSDTGQFYSLSHNLPITTTSSYFLK